MKRVTTDERQCGNRARQSAATPRRPMTRLSRARLVALARGLERCARDARPVDPALAELLAEIAARIRVVVCDDATP